MNREKDTIRKWLDEAKFDWPTGRIIRQASEDWGRLNMSAHIVAHGATELDTEFDAGFGGNGPTFIAEDAKRIYFVGTYDSATFLSWVWKDLGVYLRCEAWIEQVGGG